MSVIGTTRRLQALLAVGWNHSMLADAFALSRNTITNSLHGSIELDSLVIKVMYPSMVDGPEKPRAHALQEARRMEYFPPGAWVNTDIDSPSAGHPSRSPWLARSHPLRGQELADYVAQRLQGSDLATVISCGAGYLDPVRCAQVLARCSHAPEGRSLLRRHRIDTMDAEILSELAVMMNQMVG